MKECVECGRKLGRIEGYRHPTLGKEHLVCGKCFDAVSASVDEWRKMITSYTGFFTKETSTREDLQRIGNQMENTIQRVQRKVGNLGSHTIHQQGHDTISSLN